LYLIPNNDKDDADALEPILVKERVSYAGSIATSEFSFVWFLVEFLR
jgi:hypothetical protein